MPLHWGPGPVFVHESIAATRRWQHFASRSLFVLALLAGLALAWLVIFGDGTPQRHLTIKELASLGQYFYYAVATVQLTLVLLVAPAATADAICLDRSRGNLTHLFVTDLSNAEVVLGKLAARLVPVLALVAATVPVLALSGLLGGLILEAILSLTLITLTLAVLGCSLAMALSVRATKTHEVLMAVYGIEVAWVLGPILWEILQETGAVLVVPQWLFRINPYLLAWAPYLWPGIVNTEQLAAVLGGMLALSAGLVAYTVLRVRAEERNRSGPRVALRPSRLARACERLSAWRPRPSLDDDPVLWREWRRGRPSRLARVVWGLFVGSSIAGTTWGIVTIADDYDRGQRYLSLVNGYQATLGLLLVSLAAPTVLAEERVRGSLDVLLASPLSTDRIVLAKWWGAYRVVPALALLPAIGAICITSGDPNDSQIAGRLLQPPAPLAAIDRIAVVGLPMALLLAQGAAVTSFGLALATWIRRLGRALAVSVTSYALVAFGWIVILEMGVVTSVMTWIGLLDPGDQRADTFLELICACCCPIGAQLCTYEAVDWPATESRGAFYLGQVIVVLATLGLALLVLALTLVTFDRCVGRVPERPRRAPRPPRRAARSQGPRVRATEVRQAGLAGLEA